MNHPTYNRHKRTRFWALQDYDGSLLAVVVYKKSSQAIATRLADQDRYTLTEQGRKVLEAAESHSEQTTCK